MADSDEEYDRRRARDKFRRERSDYQERREDRGRREDFPERESWNNRERGGGGRREYRDYDPRARRERYSPPPPRHDISPPMKRMRREWNDDRASNYMGGGVGGGAGGYDMGYHGGGAGGMMGVHHGNWGAGGGGAMHHDMAMMHGDMEPGMTQPPMMTFKQFLGSQDDSIDDQEAVKKYNEYKQDFKKQQLSEFFINHKEEEWFKSKFHPEECSRRKLEQKLYLGRRLDTFLDLFEANWMDNITIDVEKSEPIIRLLDAVVIKLEGGTENDLNAVDLIWEEEKPKDEPIRIIREGKMQDIDERRPENSLKEDTPEKKSDNQNDESKESKSGDEDSSSSDSSSDSEDDSEDEEKSKKDSKEKEKKKRKEIVKKDIEVEVKKKDEPKEDSKIDIAIKMEEGLQDGEEESEKNPRFSKEDKTEALNKSEDEIKEENDDSKTEETPKVEENLGPRHLHKTCSIFLRNLAPTITKQEVEHLCRRYAGFLRVAIADPQPERRFFRRGWVTFERTVNIKDICWNLNNVRLRDCELGAIVNRDLSRRIRSVNGITAHKQVVRSDIKLTAKIIQNLDHQKGLWSSGKDSKDSKDDHEPMFNLVSKNPLLKNITDYLIEEASAEEEELLGMPSSSDDPKLGETGEEPSTTSTLERDETLIKVLDRLLLYLRIVHSVDYYNHSDYPNEDEMPNRCGIMHARGSPPNSKVSPPEINDYISTFEQKLSVFLQPLAVLPKDEALNLGMKDSEKEVEKFILSNTQELGKDKWLCPLSGKKFKGPDFIRKHIFNKHGEKVEEVKHEVEYFNNYLLDPKRPQLPEHPSNRVHLPPVGPMGVRAEGHAMGGPVGGQFMGGYPPVPPFGGAFGSHRGHPPGFGGFGGRNNYPDMPNRTGNFATKRNNFGRAPRNDQRKLITYKDLDAPSEQDMF